MQLSLNVLLVCDCEKVALLANDSSVVHPNTEGCGFESHLGIRFFLCPLMVDSLYLPLLCNISVIGWLVEGFFIGKTRGNIYKISSMPFSRYMNSVR